MKLGEARIPIMMFKSRQTTHGAWIPWEKAHRGLDDGITDLAWLPTGEEYPAYLQCFDTKMVDTELLREALNNLGISLYDWWIYCVYYALSSD